MQRVNGRFHQLAKEWRSKGNVTRNTSKPQEPTITTDASKATCFDTLAPKEQTIVPIKKAEKSLDQTTIQINNAIQPKGHNNSVSRGKTCVSTPRKTIEGMDFSIATQNAFGMLSGGQGDEHPPDRGGIIDPSK